ncbi:hypothetical protein GGQ85_000995 [Nitrobacter vulgaris]|nr:hypothetical protein [Nitrobacter vulgaris]
MASLKQCTDMDLSLVFVSALPLSRHFEIEFLGQHPLNVQHELDIQKHLCERIGNCCEARTQRQSPPSAANWVIEGVTNDRVGQSTNRCR